MGISSGEGSLMNPGALLALELIFKYCSAELHTYLQRIDQILFHGTNALRRLKISLKATQYLWPYKMRMFGTQCLNL